jgi:hypothetical protein
MYTEIDGQSDIAARIHRCCLTLFHRWCEKRSVVKLAYLMHGWPLPTSAPPQIARLSSSLLELMRSYPESFDVEDRHMLADVVLMCDRVLEQSTPKPAHLSNTHH